MLPWENTFGKRCFSLFSYLTVDKRIIVWRQLREYTFSCVPSGAHFLFKNKRENTMPDYKKMYTKLFNSVTDAIEILKQAQIETEEIYINSGEEEDKKVLKIKVLNKDK